MLFFSDETSHFYYFFGNLYHGIRGSGSLLLGLSVHAPIVPGREGVVELHIDQGWTGDLLI